jgi:hypothetical protein
MNEEIVMPSRTRTVNGRTPTEPARKMELEVSVGDRPRAPGHLGPVGAGCG